MQIWKNVKLQRIWEKSDKWIQGNLCCINCTDSATKSPQKRAKSYECFNEVTVLMSVIVVAITTGQTCPLMDRKDKGRDGSENCWWDSEPTRDEIQGSGSRNLLSQLFLFLLWKFELPGLNLRARPKDMLVCVESSLMSLRFLLIKWNQVFLLNFYEFRKRSSCATENNILSSYSAVLLT